MQSGFYRDQDLKPCKDADAEPPECLVEVARGDPRFVAARDHIPDSGIFVREPVSGRLLLCRVALLPLPAADTPAAAPASGSLGTRTDGSDGGVPAGSEGSDGTAAAASDGASGTLEGGDGTAARVNATGPGVRATPNGSADTKNPECELKYDEAKIAMGDFPQLGQLRFFPFQVGTFQAREMSLLLTEAGRIESFSYKSTKAPAQVLASTAADITAQSEAYREKRETENRDDLKYAREQKYADIQDRIDYLTKIEALKKLETPPEVDPLKATRDETAAITAEIALLKAKLERMQAEAALAAMPTGSTP